MRPVLICSVTMYTRTTLPSFYCDTKENVILNLFHNTEPCSAVTDSLLLKCWRLIDGQNLLTEAKMFPSC